MCSDIYVLDACALIAFFNNEVGAEKVEFPVKDWVEAELHAIGNIDRTIYNGPYPDGTAIGFESFELWEW